jgi:hypothetical protein
MLLKNVEPTKKLIGLFRKQFFLKYLEKKGMIKDTTVGKKEDKIDLKELLDEKNVKIKLSDIMTDYRYFKKEYYTYDGSAYAEPGDIQSPPPEPALPFTKKEMNFKKLFHYYFIKVKSYYVTFLGKCKKIILSNSFPCYSFLQYFCIYN